MIAAIKKWDARSGFRVSRKLFFTVSIFKQKKKSHKRSLLICASGAHLLVFCCRLEFGQNFASCKSSKHHNLWTDSEKRNIAIKRRFAMINFHFFLLLKCESKARKHWNEVNVWAFRCKFCLSIPFALVSQLSSKRKCKSLVDRLWIKSFETKTSWCVTIWTWEFWWRFSRILHQDR